MNKYYCTDCKHMGFDMCLKDLVCTITGIPCPQGLQGAKTCWEDKHKDTRCDNWRDYNLNPKRKVRYKQLDKFGDYMHHKYHVWLWTDYADAHDIMGGHLDWKNKGGKQ